MTIFLSVEGREFSKFKGAIGVVEKMEEVKAGNIVFGARFLINKPWAGKFILPERLARMAGCLEWYPLEGEYFPAEALKPPLDEISYCIRVHEDTNILFKGDIYGAKNPLRAHELEMRLQEILIWCQIVVDTVTADKAEKARMVTALEGEMDSKLIPYFKRIKELADISQGFMSSKKDGEGKLGRKIDMLSKKMEAGEEPPQTVAFEPTMWEKAKSKIGFKKD